MNAFLEAVGKAATLRPESVAFVNTDGDQLTYGELWNASDELACRLRDAYGKDKSPVMVFGHKSPLMLVSFLACAKSGHAYVPTDSEIPAARVANILEQLSSPVVIAVEDLPAPAVRASGPAFIVDSEVLADVMSRGASVQRPDHSWCVSGDDTQYIIFTSGSTGTPKGVEVTASDVGHFMTWDLSLFSKAKAPRTYVNQALLSFDLSVTEVVAALAAGDRIFSLSSTTQLDMDAMFKALATSESTCWVSTPSFVTLCLADKSFNRDLLPQLTHFFFCGERLHPDTVSRLLDRFDGACVMNAYGPTESTVAVTAVGITQEMCSDPLPVGYPKPGTKIVIVNHETGEELPLGAEGEIVICGDTVAKGYFRNPERTAEAFEWRMVDGEMLWSYRTGDLGHVGEDGCLWCAGRLDTQVKLHGYRIELGEIESALQELPEVDLAAAVVRERHGVADHLEAHVQLSHGVPEDAYEAGKALRHKLGVRLPGYMVPRRVVFEETLPLTPNGKVDRRALV